MELVEGTTLDATLTDAGLSQDRFLELATPLASAVAAAHAKGITHRDLKPQNVMLAGADGLKVLDFGLARFAPAEASGAGASGAATILQTQAGLAVGTVPYMSPEQIDGRAVDPRSDIFSLEVMFYEMATGRRPFTGGSDLAVVSAILKDDPRAARDVRPDLPRALAAVIDQCLRKDPTKRYRDGERLHRALVEARSATDSVETGTDAASSAGRRPAGPPLVGRDAEHGKLVVRLDDVAAGTGALVQLGGEPGVGKTRLAQEVLTEADERGMLTLTGHCYEEGQAPFAPFVEILEQLLRDSPAGALRDAMGVDAADLARLVPKIRVVLDDVPEPAVLEPEQQRRVLFNAVLDLFRRWSGRQPVVLLLDDLHWADDATVGLLQHLTPHLSTMPLLGLGTYRDVELDVGKPFQKAMAAWVRQKQAVRVPVRRLPETAVAELLTALGGSEPPDSLVEAVFQETEGNPFFVGEVFQHLSLEDRPRRGRVRRAGRGPARGWETGRTSERRDPGAADRDGGRWPTVRTRSGRGAGRPRQ
jgi:hypothetical protein